MPPKMFCQSCTMPIDNEIDRGTEKDGSYSNEYCKYCYRHGVFINPEMTLGEMKSVITEQMQNRKIPEVILQQSLTILPGLKRWKKKGE